MTGKNRWYRISLRTFLVAFTCVALAVAWFANYAQQRKAAFAAIRQAGGKIQMGFGEPFLHLPLYELWLQNTNITDASAATISQIKTLGFLQLNSTSLSDAFLEQLEPLRKLEDVGLRGTEVTGVGMQYLSRHPQLQKLDVYHTDVDDSGVEHLIACQSLTRVGLSKTKVTNYVFEHLAKLPSLADADLSANRPVTTEAVLAFEKSHPMCDIEWYRE